MINPAGIVGAYRHVENPSTWKREGSSGDKGPPGEGIERPKMVTAIAVILLMIAAYSVIMTFRDWDSVLAFAYHIAVTIGLIYCGTGFLKLKKKSLEVFFWMTGITTLVRLVVTYQYHQKAQEVLAMMARNRMELGVSTGLDEVVQTELNLTITGEVVTLAVLIPVCIYLFQKKDIFNN